MALAELLRTLEAEADERIAGLLAKARADAERLRADSAGESDRRRAAALLAREAELRATAARTLEEARREAKRRVLEARASALERIRSRSEALLAERVADPGLSSVLAGELARALEYLGTAPAVVEAPAPVLEVLGRKLGDRAQVTLQPTSAHRPDLLVRSSDGSLTVDATPASRLARAWPRLAIGLAARLETLA
jgi:vacuolar-type H+-ATPase subunit E/Vma4